MDPAPRQMPRKELPSAIYARLGLVVLLLAVCLYFPGLGAKDFHTRGEAREALVARSVLAGEWVLPSGYGGGVPSKPPLLHWAIGVLGTVLPSSDELLFRLPSAIAATLFITVFARFIALRLSPAVGWWSSCILLTSVEWWRAALTCRVDMLLSVAVAGALLALYRWHEQKLRGVPYLALLLLSAAVLAKGPVGLALPLAIALTYFWLRGERMAALVRAAFVISIPVIALASLWYIAAYRVGGEVFFEKIYAENIARFTSTMEDHPHEHSVFYLFGTLLTGFLPWTLPFVLVLATDPAQRCRLRCWYCSLRSAPPLVLFAFIACIEIFLFFSIPASKRSVYLLPMYPFLAVLAGVALSEISDHRWFSRLGKGLSIVVVGIAVALIALETLALSGSLAIIRDTGSVGPALVDIFHRSSPRDLLVSILVLVLPLEIFRRFVCSGAMRLAIGGYTILLLASASVAPLVGAALSARGFAARVQGAVPEDQPLWAFATQPYALSFYAERVAYDLGLEVPDGAFIVALARDQARLEGYVGPGTRLTLLARAREQGVLVDDLLLFQAKQVMVPSGVPGSEGGEQ